MYMHSNTFCMIFHLIEQQDSEPQNLSWEAHNIWVLKSKLEIVKYYAAGN